MNRADAIQRIDRALRGYDLELINTSTGFVIKDIQTKAPIYAQVKLWDWLDTLKLCPRERLYTASGRKINLG